MWKLGVVFVCHLWISVSAFATDCSVKLAYRSSLAASEVCLNIVSYPNDFHVMEAANNWNDGCAAGDTTPVISVGGCSDTPTIDIYYRRGRGPCGEYQGYQTTGGALVSGDITIYEFDEDDGSPCAPLVTDTLTHELGHVLGLRDIYSKDCEDHIMGPQTTYSRSIASDDCAAVNPLWTTAAEQQATCDRLCWKSCEEGVCPPQPASTTPHPTMTPILIDLDQNGFHLAGLDVPVTFDIDADGQPNRISWTAAGTGDAFLVFDRDGNGTIDNGRELFGNAAPLASGAPAPNGYEALIELDNEVFGGNGDSTLTSADVAWEFLQVWTDRNHDGISDPDEMTDLSSAGIELLETAYKRSNKHDPHGNLFRFRSTAMIRNPSGRIRTTTTYDVYLVERLGW